MKSARGLYLLVVDLGLGMPISLWGRFGRKGTASVSVATAKAERDIFETWAVASLARARGAVQVGVGRTAYDSGQGRARLRHMGRRFCAEGGGSSWVTGTYDPELDLVYWGIGNPSPWNPRTRKGDNLYTNSVIAIRPSWGKWSGTSRQHPTIPSTTMGADARDRNGQCRWNSSQSHYSSQPKRLFLDHATNFPSGGLLSIRGTWRARPGRRASSSSRMTAISLTTLRRPCGAITPNSARCARTAFTNIVRWRTSRSRPRCSSTAACCSAVLAGTKRIVGRETASQIASASAASFLFRLM